MRIQLPTGARLQNIEAFVRRIEITDSADLTLALPDTYFSVHPMTLASIGAATLKTKKRGGNVFVEHIPNTQGARYLERMGLFKLMEIDSGLSMSPREEAGRFIPLQVIRSGQQLTQFVQNLAPLLHADKHEQAEPIQYVMSELVRNTIEHAGFAEPAVVAAQVYPKTGIVAIGVADCGHGIRKGLAPSHETTSDLDAIQLAMRPGITGKTTKRGGTADNAGAGLFFCKSMALTSRNHMVIYSGSGLYKLLMARKDDERRVLYGNAAMDRATRHTDMPRWPGTVVGIDIDVNTFQEFRAILKFIRDAYDVDIKAERASANKKKAKFR